jgi:hypothetical protein
MKVHESHQWVGRDIIHLIVSFLYIYMWCTFIFNRNPATKSIYRLIAIATALFNVYSLYSVAGLWVSCIYFLNNTCGEQYKYVQPIIIIIGLHQENLYCCRKIFFWFTLILSFISPIPAAYSQGLLSLQRCLDIGLVLWHAQREKIIEDWRKENEAHQKSARPYMMLYYVVLDWRSSTLAQHWSASTFSLFISNGHH